MTRSYPSLSFPGSHHPIMVTVAPTTSPGPTSAPGLGAAAEDGGNKDPGLRTEEDAIDPLSLNRAIHANDMVTDYLPQSPSPPYPSQYPYDNGTCSCWVLNVTIVEIHIPASEIVRLYARGNARCGVLPARVGGRNPERGWKNVGCQQRAARSEAWYYVWAGVYGAAAPALMPETVSGRAGRQQSVVKSTWNKMSLQVRAA
ncbi:hypothetical protein EDB84DRAFT_1442284 [Lactarius hengduanensis]|nr:hypothetical protein EDB84DRAFT_1442284 [Lactarius hengduanensis]